MIVKTENDSDPGADDGNSSDFIADCTSSLASDLHLDADGSAISGDLDGAKELNEYLGPVNISNDNLFTLRRVCQVPIHGGSTFDRPGADASPGTAGKALDQDADHKRKHMVKPKSWERYRKKRKKKIMGDGCGDSCRLKCSQTVSTTTRKALYEQFWAAEDVIAQQSIVLNSAIRDTKSRERRRECSPGVSRRTNTIKYYLNEFKVCKKMYMDTFAISDLFINKAYHDSEGLHPPVT